MIGFKPMFLCSPWGDKKNCYYQNLIGSEKKLKTETYYQKINILIQLSLITLCKTLSKTTKDGNILSTDEKSE